MCETDTPYPTLPFKHFKGNMSKPRATRIYHSNSMRDTARTRAEINLRGAPYELGTYDRYDQRRLRRACVFAQSRQGLAH